MPRKRPQPSKPVLIAREMGAARLVPARGGTGIEFIRSTDNALLVVGSKSAQEGRVGVVRNVGAPLDYYLHRSVIDMDQYSAGERLRIDHYSAFGSGFHAVNLDGFHGVSNRADNWRFSNHQSDCLRSFIDAANSLDDKTRKIVEAVCVQGIFAKDAARTLKVPGRVGVEILRSGLTALCRHYQNGRDNGVRPSQG